MICLIQRVSHGSISVQQKIIAQISTGLVALTGFRAGYALGASPRMRNLLRKIHFGQKFKKILPPPSPKEI